MERKPVSSGNLAAVGYDEAAKVLEVEFKNGSVYQYTGFQADDYAAFMAADSKGSYLNQNIKNVFPYSKVG